MSDLRGDFKVAETAADGAFQKLAKYVGAHPKTALAVIAVVGIVIVLLCL